MFTKKHFKIYSPKILDNLIELKRLIQKSGLPTEKRLKRLSTINVGIAKQIYLRDNGPQQINRPLTDFSGGWIL